MTKEYALQVRMPVAMAKRWKRRAKKHSMTLSGFVRRAMELVDDADGLVEEIAKRKGAPGTTRPKSATPHAQSSTSKLRVRRKASGRATVKAPSDGDSGRLRAKG
jgi:hypothetical protein